jgi:bifunctional pyridoxal-dependent enzyme with beta-cystathionase and maltose regulon repressor activities
MSASSMLGIYYSVVRELTTENDSILIFTPTYYRFMFTLKDQKRNIIEY